MEEYERITLKGVSSLGNKLYQRLSELEDKIENGELVSKDWHDEQVLHAESEIERLKLILKSISDENNRLREAIENFTVKKCGLRCEIVKTLIKEFAEKLKERLNADYVNGGFNNHKGHITEWDIDGLLKEYDNGN